MDYVNNSLPSLSPSLGPSLGSSLGPTFACALTPQYVNVFQRHIPHYVTIILCVFNIAFALVSTSLNLLVMAAIVSTPKLQTPTFVLLCNLAFTDFVIGLVIGSIEVVYLITRAVGQYDNFCTTWKVLVVLCYILCPASLYTITSISFDRYLSLLMRIRYKTVVTRRKACITVVIIWVWSGLGTTLMAALGKEPFLILACCISFFCLVVIIDCYLLSFDAIRKHKNEIQASTFTEKDKSKRINNPQKDNIRVNKGRKGIKRAIESFGRENEELKRMAKSRDVDIEDTIGQYEPRDFQTENDDAIGRWDSLEEFDNESLKDLDNDDEERTVGGRNVSLSGHLSVLKAKEDLGKRRHTSSSANRYSQLETLGGKAQHTIDSTKMKYLLVKKDIESVVEEVEVEGKQKQARKEENIMIPQDDLTGRSEMSQPSNTNGNRVECQGCDKNTSTKLTSQKAELLAEVSKFKQTLHTILFIVVALFLCYLPYVIVSTLVTLGLLDIGIAWDVAASIVYMNSSISPIIMCTRIASIRNSCRRVLRRVFRV